MTLLFHERGVLNSPDAFLQVQHLYMKGTNVEIGAQIGGLARHRHQIEKKPVPDPLIAQCQNKYIETHYPIHWERMKGFAQAYGQSLDDTVCDFSTFGSPLGNTACSAVYYPPQTTVLHHGMLSRNLDFDIPLAAPQSIRERRTPFAKTYIMELRPDVGYASLTLFCFEVFGQALEGINSEGLAVVHLADATTATAFPHAGTGQLAVGLNEFLPIQLLLDTCSTAREAQEALLLNKHYYRCVPVHLLVADRAGNSFVWETGSIHNSEHIIDGKQQPQIVTNFLLHRYAPDVSFPETDPDRNSPENRFRILQRELRSIAGQYTPDFIRCTNLKVFYLDPMPHGKTASTQIARTLFHNIYDLDARTVRISFYLGEGEESGVENANVLRSEYIEFALG